MRVLGIVTCVLLLMLMLLGMEASAQIGLFHIAQPSTAQPPKPSRQPQQTSRQPQPPAVRDESKIKRRLNSWTIGLAAGLPEGAPLRFATELARIVEDGDRMRVIPLVTRGPSDNVNDLLHLRGVDAAILFGDVLESVKNDRTIAGLERRINYIMPLFPSELHVFVRPEINKLEDLAGKPVNFNTKGTAAAYSGPIIFERLGIKIEPRFDPHPVALGEMKKSDKYAAVVFVSSKPLDPFVKGTWPEGYKFLPVPLTEKLEQYYVPAQLEAADYPSLIPAGQKIATISVPSVLAVFNWPQNHQRYKRLERFVDYLFDRFPKLQTEPGYHPRWKELNLAASVPGWRRFPAMQAKLATLMGARPGTDQTTRKSAQPEPAVNAQPEAAKGAQPAAVKSAQLEHLGVCAGPGQAQQLRRDLDRLKAQLK
jgi:hypothetical protein